MIIDIYVPSVNSSLLCLALFLYDQIMLDLLIIHAICWEVRLMHNGFFLLYSHIKALNLNLCYSVSLWSIKLDIVVWNLKSSKDKMYVFFLCNNISNSCWRLNDVHVTNIWDAQFIKFQKVAAKCFKIKNWVHFFNVHFILASFRLPLMYFGFFERDVFI